MADNLYCLQLAHNAVHGAMAGFSSFIVGLINTWVCYVPVEVVANRRNVINTGHETRSGTHRGTSCSTTWGRGCAGSSNPASTTD